MSSCVYLFIIVSLWCCRWRCNKMPQKRMEYFRLLFDHLAWIEHQFLSGIRDSRKAGSLRGMMRGVGGVRRSEHQSWLAKGLGLGLRLGLWLLFWGFKGVQEEIHREEARTLQIGSVAFPPGQCTCPQLQLCHRQSSRCILQPQPTGQYIYIVPSISFLSFFVQAFKIVVVSWKFSM